jgi:exonuclease III
MLQDFCKHDLDIVLLQEVTHTGFTCIAGSNVYTNVGTDRRGTAIMTKDGMSLTGIERLPSGRGITGWFRNIFIVSIYASSGTSRRTDWEEFYNLDLTYLLRNFPTNYVIVGDFNCVTHHTDYTGTPSYSKVLDTHQTLWAHRHVEYIRHPATMHSLHPTWAYQNRWAVYVPILTTPKQSAAIIPAAFTDHHAALVRLRLNVPQVKWGRCTGN